MDVYESRDYAEAEKMYYEWYGSTNSVPFTTKRYEQLKKGDSGNNTAVIAAWIILILVIVVIIWKI